MKNAVTITPWNEEEHIVSVIVHVQPVHSSAVEQLMDTLEGVERITQDASGRYVLLISAPTAKRVMEQIETIQDADGVLSAAMIAHHTEAKESLDETIEMSDVVLAQDEEQETSRRLQ